jgi:hypothetical protein
MLKVGVNWPDFKPNLCDLGPVLLKLLDSLEVKISLSQKELVFKLFFGTAVSTHSFTIRGSCHTAASRAGSESVFNFVPDSHLIYAILPPRASTDRFLASYKSFLFFLSPLSHLLSRDKVPQPSATASDHSGCCLPSTPRRRQPPKPLSHRPSSIPWHKDSHRPPHPVGPDQADLDLLRPSTGAPTYGWALPSALAAGLSSLTCCRPAVTPLGCCLVVLVFSGGEKRAACSIDLS